MKHVCIALAEGFEEIEGLTVVDLLRRAEIKVTTASIGTTKEVIGAHTIPVIADALFDKVDLDTVDMLVLPGGMPGTLNLQKDERICTALKDFIAKGKEIAAICAAPLIPGNLGLLKGKKACCYPSFEDQLHDAKVVFEPVAVDEQVITSRGMGTAIDFALALITRLKNEEIAAAIRKAIIYNNIH